MTTGPQNAIPFGKYLLLKKLAVGGMAELYLAKDAPNDRLVVIKRILPYLAQENEFVRMFLDEARIAAQLHHPHIIQMHELGHLEGSIFIAMEFVEGVDLRKILQQEQKRQSVVPPDIAAWLTSRLCDGLHYAHNKGGADGQALGIIHRDVSPQNLMVGYQGEVKLVDFGIAKASSVMERSKPGVIKGKFLYLSPEQLSQERIDHRADLFAVGTMLYEVTTGKSPFYKPTTEAVIYAIRAEDPPPPHLLQKGFPVELSRIIMRCLLKDRSRRYQQAGEIHSDLEAWMRNESPTTMATVVDYVDKLFGDQDERTSIFIPANAQSRGEPQGRGERTRIEGTPRRPLVAGEMVVTTPGTQPIRTNSNPTLPIAPFNRISEETTKPIAAPLPEKTNPMVGRRPTPAPDSVSAVPTGEGGVRTQTVRPADIARALGTAKPANPSVITTPEARSRPGPPVNDNEHTANTAPIAKAAVPLDEIEPTAISNAGRLNTGESLVDLTPNEGSAPAPTPAPPPPAKQKSRDFPSYEDRPAVVTSKQRSRDFPVQPPERTEPIADQTREQPAASRSSSGSTKAAQPQTDPGSGPSDTFADVDDAISYDPSDEESTIDYRSNSKDDVRPSSPLVAPPRRLSSTTAPEPRRQPLLVRKPWLIAVIAFVLVLVVGLVLVMLLKPGRAGDAPVDTPPAVGSETGAPEEPASPGGELVDSNKAIVQFVAPLGTKIAHDGKSFEPNKPYAIFQGPFSLMYRCPGKKKQPAPQAVNMTVTLDRNHGNPQLIPLDCH